MKHLGQTKERKPVHTMGLRIVMMKSHGVKTLRMTRLSRQVLRRDRSDRSGRGGASNKHTFSKVSQIVFSQGLASAT